MGTFYAMSKAGNRPGALKLTQTQERDGSEVRIAVRWSVLPVQLQRRFGDIYCLRLSVLRISEATKQATYSFTLKTERVFSPKRR